MTKPDWKPSKPRLQLYLGPRYYSPRALGSCSLGSWSFFSNFATSDGPEGARLSCDGRENAWPAPHALCNQDMAQD